MHMTPRLHHETLDNTEMCCRGLFILVLLIMNHTVDDVLLKGIKFYEKKTFRKEEQIGMCEKSFVF